MSDGLPAIIDYATRAAVDGSSLDHLSLPALYRLFIVAYEGDDVAARAAFTRYMQGQMPNDVLAYCCRLTGERPCA